MAGIEIATGGMMVVVEKKEESFIKKYNLEGKGCKTRVSKKTQDAVRAMALRGEAYSKLSEAAALSDNTRYGR